MKYRVSLNIVFDTLAEALDSYEKLFVKRANMRTINVGALNEERSQIMLHECYHDEDPTKPCVILKEWSSS